MNSTLAAAAAAQSYETGSAIRTDMNALHEGLSAAINKVRELRYRAGDLANSAFGSRPEACAEPGALAPELPNLAAMIRDLHNEIDGIAAQLARF